MDVVLEFCERVLGGAEPATEAAAEAHRSGARGRVKQLAAAARACRSRADRQAARVEAPAGASLTDAVAAELALATSKLPEPQREALALRELFGLPYAQIAKVMAIAPPEVARLLAQSRLGLRAVRRGEEPAPEARCTERDRALRALARRQDSEPLSADDDAWLLQHLGLCPECTRAHGAMLEASVCYRAWRPRSGAGAGPRELAGVGSRAERAVAQPAH